MNWEDEIPDLEGVKASDVEDLSGGRASDVPDTDKWAGILMSGSFADGIYMIDQAFLNDSYESEVHVGVNAFNQVEYQSFPRPDILDLMIADDYDRFMSEVSDPFFSCMDRDEFRTPPDSDIEIGFGGYRETKPIELGLEAMDVRVPTLSSYNDRVMGDAFSDEESGYTVVQK